MGGRVRANGVPDLPEEFWQEPVLREALASRHMGQVIRAWRTHPQHGRHPFAQDRVAVWMGITQAQLSRIETGPPPAHLDRLVQWAQVLHIPQERLWFALPEERPRAEDEEGSVKRRGFLAAAGLTVAGGVLPPGPADSGEADGRTAVEWLAWHLWQHRAHSAHSSAIPAYIARGLNRHAHVTRDAEEWYRFSDDALIDVLVAQRVFADIESGSAHLLATAQTSHATDLAMGALAAGDDRARRSLASWMQRGPTPVLRVNAAGVLAKIGSADLGDAAISTIRTDPDARQLYLTAVASRVLATGWEEAGQLVTTGFPQDGHGHEAWAAERLLTEIENPRDAVARWCSTVLLHQLHRQLPDAARIGFAQALRREHCRENLRAFAAALAGMSPLAWS
jgi:transcriptional regulator with XRE-family HTH domain